MRCVSVVAIVAALACLASAEFRGPLAGLFNTWTAGPVKLVKDFDHLAKQYTKAEVHEAEHIRKKRNAEEAHKYMSLAQSNPITTACDRPGYTGQYCEFPICMETNFFVDPSQWETNVGYYTDITDLGNCSSQHVIIVDETMGDIRIEVQSLDNVNPRFVVFDASGWPGTPDGELKEPDRYEVYFKYMKAGEYRIVPSGDNEDSRCLLSTTAQTIITISGGFTTDNRDRNDFPNPNAAVHQFNSIMLHLNGARSPAELKTISVIGPNNFEFRPRILDKRYGCGYEYYFDSLFCYIQGSYALQVEGVDFYGNPFRRAAVFGCLNGPQQPTSAPITTTLGPTNPTGCNNGGILVNDGNGHTNCVCQDHYTGYDCSQRLCINGGTLIQGKCFCQTGFEGDHCENVRCEPNSDHGYGVDRPTLVLVVRVREQMNDVMQQVKDAVDNVVSDLQFDPTYLSRFHVVFFNDYNVFLSKHYTSIIDFDNDFLKATIASQTDGNCTDSVMGAVATGLTDLALTSNSKIYVITDALADDNDKTVDAILQWNSYWRATINFIYVEPQVGANCKSDVDDPGFRSFVNLANTFGGLAFHVDDRSRMYDIMYGHMSNTIYRSQLMLTVDRDECGNGLVKAVHIEKNNENLVLITKGRQFYPLITNPEGVHLTEDMIDIVVQQDYLTIWKVKNPIPGAYFIRATTNPPSAACNIRAYQSSYLTYSNKRQVEAFWTVTTDIDVDGMMYQPLSGIDNHIVFHVDNLDEEEDYDHAFAFLNLYAWRDGREQEVYASNGIYRTGCSYHYYFPQFRCRANELLHYEFFVRNDEGFYVQRAGVMDCMNSHPTPVPPTECQNGGVRMNGTCLCQPHFTGTHCETTICENGGTPGFGPCMCPSGWSGYFCITPICQNPGNPPTFGYKVDMVFLVEVTKKGVKQIQELATSLPAIISDLQSQHKDWIQRLVLVGYDSKDVVGMVDAPIDSPTKFWDALNAWSNSNPTDDNCVVRVWEAIYQVLNNRQNGISKRTLPRRSIVNIFEANIPDNIGDAIQALSTSEALLETNALTNVFQWRDDSTPSGWTCNGNQSDFQYIEQAARRGDGKMYNVGTGEISSAIKMIPTLFSSSIVYKFHTEDCTVEQNIYFPVDAYTQTVSAIVSGYQTTVDLHRWTGSLFNKDGRIGIYRNDMEQIVEYRNPCDSDWMSISQYCMYFNAATTMIKTFNDASGYCQNEGAFLADDLSDEKNNWLISNLGGQKIWLGLQYDGFTWGFQHDDGSIIPVPSTLNYWDGGKTPDGTTGKCAIFDPKGTNGYWFATDCASEYRAVCQKHMYDGNNQPSSIDDDDLSPGKYFLTVTAMPGAPNGWKGCDVEVRVQSDLNVEFGFVDGLRRDDPHPVANIDSNSNRVVASISIGQGKTDTSLLKHVQLRTDDHSSMLLEAATYSYRFACSYEYYSQELNCDETNGQDFSVVHIGEDDTGNTFQRYSTSLCYKWQVCSNGGVYSNGACLCPDYWTGDTCRSPICQNGGKDLGNGQGCSCLDGFGGDVCQFVQCLKNSGDTFTNEGKSLVLLIEKSSNTAKAIQKLADTFSDILDAVNARKENWLNYYFIHTFTYEGNIEDMAMYTTAEDVVNRLYLVANDSVSMTPSCQMPIFDALNGMFGQYSMFLNGAEVLLISASAPLDTNVPNIHAAMEEFDAHTPIVDFIHIETDTCPPESWLTDLSLFDGFLSNTGGTIFRADENQIGDALKAFLPTRYAAQILTPPQPTACQVNTNYIQVETAMKDVFIIVSGKNPTAFVTNPLQGVEELNVLYTSDEQNLWSFKPNYPGIYSVTTSSASELCFPVVYGSGVQILFGFIQGNNTLDSPLPYAVYGLTNYPVFYVLDPDTQQRGSETLYMADMFRQTFDGLVDKPYTTDIDYRTGCTWNYIGKPFECANNDEMIFIDASGVDSNNQAFTRASSTWCKTGSDTPPTSPTVISTTVTTPSVPVTGTTTVPTTTPAPTPKTILFDILFIVDETEEPSFLHDVAEPFIEQTMSIYSTTQARARVGLITMPQKAGMSMPVAFLSSIDSWETLQQDLLSLEDFNLAGDKEYLVQALSFANDNNKYKKKENGYRAQIDNHLIVILTAKNTIDDLDGALEQIDNISKDGSYGIIAVGYGAQSDWNVLQKLAGDCTSTAANKEALMSNTIDFIQSQIWNATFNGGNYCAPSNSFRLY